MLISIAAAALFLFAGAIIITCQTTLAKEIGENKGYQEYLVTIKQVEANQAVGIAQAEAVKVADIKIIATAGSVQSGLSSVSDVFSAKGGTAMGAMVSALSQNPDVVSIVKQVATKLTDTKAAH